MPRRNEIKMDKGKKVLTMDDFYFAVGSDPRDVFVVVGEKWILYKHCETEEIARAIVDGQNKSRGESKEE